MEKLVGGAVERKAPPHATARRGGRVRRLALHSTGPTVSYLIMEAAAEVTAPRRCVRGVLWWNSCVFPFLLFGSGTRGRNSASFGASGDKLWSTLGGRSSCVAWPQQARAGRQPRAQGLRPRSCRPARARARFAGFRRTTPLPVVRGWRIRYESRQVASAAVRVQTREGDARAKMHAHLLQ